MSKERTILEEHDLTWHGAGGAEFRDEVYKLMVKYFGNRVLAHNRIVLEFGIEALTTTGVWLQVAKGDKPNWLASRFTLRLMWEPNDTLDEPDCYNQASS